MSETNGRYDTDGGISLQALCELIGAANVAQLALVVDEVLRRTGWGDVHLVIADGKVTHIKGTVSVKLDG